MRKTFPAGSVYTNLTDVKDACSGGYQDALKFAQRECGRGTYMSRGRHFKALRDDKLVAGEAECWPWDGTMRGLLEAIDDAILNRADTLVIEGGIDYAVTPRDYAECAYDPWVGEWHVTVWRKAA
jgi:hypothetical protein